MTRIYAFRLRYYSEKLKEKNLSELLNGASAYKADFCSVLCLFLRSLDFNFPLLLEAFPIFYEGRNIKSATINLAGPKIQPKWKLRWQPTSRKGQISQPGNVFVFSSNHKWVHGTYFHMMFDMPLMREQSPAQLSTSKWKTNIAADRSGVTRHVTAKIT